VIDAVIFLASNGHLFLPLYNFDLASGTWTHKHDAATLQSFSLDAALSVDEAIQSGLSLQQRKERYGHYMAEAHRWVEKLQSVPSEAAETLQGELGELQFFPLSCGTVLKQ